MEKSRLRTVCTYGSTSAVDLYANPDLTEAASQLDAGWPVQYVENTQLEKAILVESMLDGYRGWMALEIAETLPVYSGTLPIALEREAIEGLIPAVLAHARSRANVPSVYRWGGNLGPNFDCSGLVQWSFAQEGIWLPRDAFHQADFTLPIERHELSPGDLVFFGETYVSHVALWLGEGNYIHSSGKERGHDGIAIDRLDGASPIEIHYASRLRGFGRVMRSRGA